MYGYIKPEKSELKGRDIARYTSYYCVLCHVLGKRFGGLYRLMLSNDMTFLLICLDSVSTEKTKIEGRCPGNIFRKFATSLSVDAVDYVASLTYYLALQKIYDNSLDDSTTIGKFIYKLCFYILHKNRKYRRWERGNSALVEKLNAQFLEFRKGERETFSFDYLTHLFGTIVETFISGFEKYFDFREAFLPYKHLYYNLGKWIYLIDALNDFEKDRRKGEFNLLQTLRIGKGAQRDEECIRKSKIILFLIQRKIAESYVEISTVHPDPIVENIVVFGISDVSRKILTIYNARN